jgi:hypothetical protein
VARLPPTMKELLVVPGAGHNDASAHPSFAAAIGRLLARGAGPAVTPPSSQQQQSPDRQSRE